VATLAARLIEVCDGAAAAINTAWVPVLPNAITRDYAAELQTVAVSGRQVFVSPPIDDDEPARQIQKISRSEVINGFKVRVEIYEKYTLPGMPPKAWLDTRVQFVDTIYTALDLITPGAYLLSSLWCEEMAKVYIADAEAVFRDKMFFAAIDADFHELVEG
jgi:hypothetical protein